MCFFFYGNGFFPIRSSVHPTIHTSIFVFQHLCVCNPRLFSHPFHFENSVRNIQMMYGLGPAQQGLSWFPDSFYITHKYIHPNTFICVCGLKNNIYCYFSPNRKQNEINKIERNVHVNSNTFGLHSMVISHFSHRCFSNSNCAPQLTAKGGELALFFSFLR